MQGAMAEKIKLFVIRTRAKSVRKKRLLPLRVTSCRLLPVSAAKNTNDRPKICHSLAVGKSFLVAKFMVNCPRFDRIRQVGAQTVATGFCTGRSSGRSPSSPAGGDIFRSGH